MNFRIIRFALNGGGYECLITNLTKEEFTTEEIKELCHLRWKIETSFRKLKYTIGLNYFHGKKEELVLQEIYSRVIMYNFSQIIAGHVITEKKNKKWKYKVDFKQAASVCRKILTGKIKAKEIVKLLVERNMIPSRPDRAYERTRMRIT